MMKKIIIIFMALFILKLESTTNTKRPADQLESPATKYQKTESVKFKSEDGQIILVPKSVAKSMQTIEAHLPNYSEDQSYEIKYPAAIIEIVISIMKNIQDDSSLKKNGLGKYISQQLQPLIDSTLKNKSIEQISLVAEAAEFLGIEEISNGAIRVWVAKQMPEKYSYSNEENRKKLDSLIDKSKAINISEIKLSALIRKQYTLLSSPATPEENVADYIALHGQPKITWLLDKRIFELRLPKSINSLEGLSLVQELSKVKKLNAYDNRITSLNAQLLNPAAHLEILNLDHNNLIIEPDTFKRMNKLKELTLGDNLDITLYSGLFNGLQALTNLGIEGIPFTLKNQILKNAGLKNLTKLTIDAVSIEPGAFYGLEKLEYLSPHITKLTKNSFIGLNNLKEIDMEESHTKEIEIGAFNGLGNLEIINLGQTHLESLKPGVFNNLTPVEANRLNKLKKISLAASDIRHIPVGLFNGLNTLETLYLNTPELTIAPGALKDLPALKKLYIESDIDEEELKKENNLSDRVQIIQN